jgi:hypothetical protein
MIACRKQECIITGILPGEMYDNEWIYLVPLQDATAETVDSARVEGNTFRIIPSVHNKEKPVVIRARPRLRIALQEIVIIAEAGEINVRLDSSSIASGTPMNNTLQQWKELKEEYENRVYILRRQILSQDSAARHETEADISRYSDLYRASVSEIIRANSSNAAGRLLSTLYGLE